MEQSAGKKRRRPGGPERSLRTVGGRCDARRVRRIPPLLAIASSTACGQPAAPAHAGIKAEVVRVIDGDTLIVNESGHPLRVRLIGLDAPEIDDPRHGTSGECFAGPAADAYAMRRPPAVW